MARLRIILLAAGVGLLGCGLFINPDQVPPPDGGEGPSQDGGTSDAGLDAGAAADAGADAGTAADAGNQADSGVDGGRPSGVAACATVNFSSPLFFLVGLSSPGALAVADINGDGRYDLVAVSTTDRALAILLGDGDGGFGPPRVIPIANAIDTQIVAGDLNGDGLSDLIVTGVGDYGVVEALVDGGSQVSTFSTGGNLVDSVALADLNGDGREDAYALYDYWMGIRPGDGDGGLGPEYDAGGVGTGFSYIRQCHGALADFNGDGLLDVSYGGGADTASSARQVWVALQQDGGFPRSVQIDGYTDSADVQAIAVGDFDDDGRMDFVAALRRTTDLHAIVDVWRNDGGTFDRITSVRPDGGSPNAIGVGDFNGDGDLDIALTDPIAAAGAVVLILNHGDGGFGPGMHFDTGYVPYGLAIADFNGDGLLDLAVANPVADAGTVAVLLNTCSPAFPVPACIPLGNVCRGGIPCCSKGPCLDGVCH